MTIVGYARVSTLDQNSDLQVDALTKAGCQKIYIDQASGTKAERPELSRCLDFLRPEDTLVVWSIDRLGRSTRNLLDLVEQLQLRRIDIVVTTMGIDTRTTMGKLFFTIVAAFSEAEHNGMRERTMAGLAAARARGRVGGRKPSLSTRQALIAREMYEAKGPDGKRLHTVQEIADDFKVARNTLYRYIRTSEPSR